MHTDSLSIMKKLRANTVVRNYQLFIAMAGFHIFLLYLSWLREGNSKFASLWTYAIVTVMISTVLIVATILLVGNRRERQPISLRPFEVKTLCFLSTLASAFSIVFYYNGEKALLVLLLFLIVTSVSLSLSGRGRTLSNIGHVLFVFAALALYIVICIVQIGRFELGSQSDMLLIVEKAVEAFISFEQPYGFYSVQPSGMESYSVPLTYFPLTWLIYLPAYLIDFDPRWINVTLIAGSTLFAAVFLKKNTRNRELVNVQLCILIAVLLNGYFIHRIDSEIFLTGIVLALLCLSVLYQKTRLAAGLFGMGIATSPLIGVLAPILIIHYYRNLGFRNLITFLTLSGSAAAVFFLPIMVWSAAEFFTSTVIHWQSLESYPSAWALGNIKNLNFSVFFYADGNQQYLKFLQVALLTIMAGLYLKRPRAPEFSHLLVFLFLSLFLFLIFNIIVWTYLFFPLAVLFMLLLQHAIARPPLSLPQSNNQNRHAA